MRTDGQTDRHDGANSRFFAILQMHLKNGFIMRVIEALRCPPTARVCHT